MRPPAGAAAPAPLGRAPLEVGAVPVAMARWSEAGGGPGGGRGVGRPFGGAGPRGPPAFAAPQPPPAAGPPPAARLLLKLGLMEPFGTGGLAAPSPPPAPTSRGVVGRGGRGAGTFPGTRTSLATAVGGSFQTPALAAGSGPAEELWASPPTGFPSRAARRSSILAFGASEPPRLRLRRDEFRGEFPRRPRRERDLCSLAESRGAVPRSRSRSRSRAESRLNRCGLLLPCRRVRSLSAIAPPSRAAVGAWTLLPRLLRESGGGAARPSIQASPRTRGGGGSPMSGLWRPSSCRPCSLEYSSLRYSSWR
mmetsp:Transcript_29768/g.81606  ORF Transcript_29768/g.81606 Transcript_29768/m.81606 type:complete len:308 (-) Transcript_29768:1791-2714(-)